MPTTRWLPRTALAVAILGSLTSCGESRATPGGGLAEAERQNATGFPLQGPDFEGSALKPVRGTSFAHGMLIIFNTGSTQLRLDRVTPIDVGEGLRPLGVRVAGLDREIGFDQSSDWPVTRPVFGRVRPPGGFVLEPTDPVDGRGYLILLGYNVVGQGRSTVKGVRVDYTDLGDGSARTITSMKPSRCAQTLPLMSNAPSRRERSSEWSAHLRQRRQGQLPGLRGASPYRSTLSGSGDETASSKG